MSPDKVATLSVCRLFVGRRFVSRCFVGRGFSRDLNESVTRGFSP
jgi:hypothetical protein